MGSTTVDLCLRLFPWADFRSTQAAVKAHAVINSHRNFFVMITITTEKVHNVKVLGSLRLPPAAIVVLNRTFADFTRL